MHADLVQAGSLREVEAWGKFDVYSSREACNVQNEIAQTRRSLTWKMANGKMFVEARLAATGSQDPDQEGGLVEPSRCVSLRSSHLQAIPLGAIRKWTLRNLDIKNAFLEADGFDRHAFLRSPEE